MRDPSRALGPDLLSGTEIMGAPVLGIRVLVGVEEAIDEQLLVEDPDELGGDVVRVELQRRGVQLGRARLVVADAGIDQDRVVLRPHDIGLDAQHQLSRRRIEIGRPHPRQVLLQPLERLRDIVAGQTRSNGDRGSRLISSNFASI